METKYYNANEVFNNIQRLEDPYYPLKEFIDNLNERIYLTYYLDGHIRENFGRYISYNIQNGNSIFHLNLFKTLVKNRYYFNIFDNQDSEVYNSSFDFFREYHQLLFNVKQYTISMQNQHYNYCQLVNKIGKFNIKELFISNTSNVLPYTSNISITDRKQSIRYHILNRCFDYFSYNGIHFYNKYLNDINKIFTETELTNDQSSFLLQLV